MKKAIAILGSLYLVVLVASIAVFVGDDFSSLEGISYSPILLLLAFGLSLVWVLGQSVLWGTLLKDSGTYPKHIDPLRNFFFAKAWLGRYIPGKLAGFAVLGYQGVKLGFSTQKSSVTAVTHPYFSYVVLAVIGWPSIFFSALPKWLLAAHAGAILVLALSVPLLGRKSFALRLIRKTISRIKPSLIVHNPIRRNTFAASILLAGGLAILSGFIQVVILQALSVQVDFRLLVFVISISALAVFWGGVFFIAPAGIGVREFVILSGSGLFLSQDTALSWAILSRLVSIGSDLLFYLLCWWGAKTTTEKSN